MKPTVLLLLNINPARKCRHFLLLTLIVLLSKSAWANYDPKLFAISGQQEWVYQIQNERDRITLQYPEYGLLFSLQIDSTVSLIRNGSFAEFRKVHYLRRLYIFLTEIDKYYSKEYFNSGRYQEVLAYYPTLIDWHETGSLEYHIHLHPRFSLKAIALIPDDSICHTFLLKYMQQEPDEVLRNTDAFYDRPFAVNIINEIARLAPESVKKYFATMNNVNALLTKSTDPVKQTLYDIYKKNGYRSNAYLLVDDIYNRRMTVQQADSLQAYPFQLFRHLVKLMNEKNLLGRYSVNRMLMNYSIDAARSLNNFADANGNIGADALNKYTSEQLFIISVYGFRELRPVTFKGLMGQLRQNTNGLFTEKLLAAMDERKLSEFMRYCDQLQLMTQVAGMFDPAAAKNSLNKYLMLEEAEEEPKPLLHFFGMFEFAKSRNLLTWVSPMSTGKPLASVPQDNPDAGLPVVTRDAEPATMPEPAKPLEASAPPIRKEPTPDIVKQPDIVPLLVKPVSIQISDDLRQMLILKKNPSLSIQQLPSFIEQRYAKDFLMYMADHMPDEVFKRAEYFRGRHFTSTVLEQAARYAPLSANRYLYNKAHPVAQMLAASKDPFVQALIEMHDKVGYQTKALLLADEIFNGTITLDDAMAISKDNSRFYPRLMKLLLRQDAIGRYNMEREITDYSLRLLRDINEKIALRSTTPYEQVESFSSDQLLVLMIYGRDEVFNTTYKGLLQRFLSRLPVKTAEYFQRYTTDLSYRKFISLCATNGQLSFFLMQFPAGEQQKLLQRFVGGLEHCDVQDVTMVAECLTNVTFTDVNRQLHLILKKEFERNQTADHAVGIAFYGLLINEVLDKVTVERDWFAQVSSYFKSGSLNTLAINSLLGKNHTCYQQMFFYNDGDGRASYANFVKSFKALPNWTVEDNYNYIKVSSTSGVKVELYANKPEYEENGIDAIRNYFKSSGIQPSVTIHRGYSFHTEKTIEYVTASNKLVFLGSCGGFYKIALALNNAPDAQYIATRQIGTLGINDPLIVAINEMIRKNQDIDWPTMWETMRLKLGGNPLFYDYVPPHKNLEFLFTKEYYNLMGV